MHVHLVNLGPSPAHGWATFTVPKGSSPLAILDPADGECEIHRVEQELEVYRVRCASPIPPASERIVRLRVRSDGEKVEPKLPQTKPLLEVLVDGKPWTETFLEERGGLLHRVGRVNNGLLAIHVWQHHFPGQTAVPYEVAILASNPSIPDQECTHNVTLVARDGFIAAPWFAEWRGGVVQGGQTQILKECRFADGQGQGFVGCLVHPADPRDASFVRANVVARASEGLWWRTWGAFGCLPNIPTLGSAWHGKLHRWLGRSKQASPWDAPDLGLRPHSGQTGPQEDFGATKLGWAFYGSPAWILMAQEAAIAELCRPNAFCEADGQLYNPHEHPSHVTWDGRTHFHRSVSSDRLGKVGAQPWLSGGWSGVDREHWSNNTLAGAYALTGSPLLGLTLQRQANLIISGETLDPRLSTSGAGAPRGIGRTLQSARWMRRLLDRPDVEERITKRIEKVIEPQTRPPQGAVLAPLGTIRDPRYLGGTECWSPWQEALGIMGLYAWLDTVPAELLDPLLERVVATWIRFGWYKRDGRWWLADSIAYRGGAPVADSEYDDPSIVERREGFEEWAGGAVQIAYQILGEPDLIERAVEILDQYDWLTMEQCEWLATR